jgi:hypothetical protein
MIFQGTACPGAIEIELVVMILGIFLEGRRI